TGGAAGAQPAGAAAPAGGVPENITTGAKQYVQTIWYGADGQPLTPPDAKEPSEAQKSLESVLGKHGLGGPGVNPTGRPDAYNALLQKPVGDRGDTVSWYNSEGKQQSEKVPDDVRSLTQVKFIPGGASCQRASIAMAAEAGTEIEGGSG